MPREFQIPQSYRSEKISALKEARRASDARKRDFSPTLLQFSKIEIGLARFFGFCYGVENAIERAYQAVEENSGKRVFLLSEMIHNPFVNQNLQAKGVRFLQSAKGEVYIPLSELNPDDVVIVPAFGTTTTLFSELKERGIAYERYDATCPFVEKVWKRAAQLGALGFTVVIHGKHEHEETRATFSHASVSAPSIVVRDKVEAKLLVQCIKGEVPNEAILDTFGGRMSQHFNPSKHLSRVGVVNQTTMLASETHEISLLFREAFLELYGEAKLAEHFADTRDTLCYATNENQSAADALGEFGGDLAIVVGGYNSSNTSHLVELLEPRCPTFFIRDASEIASRELIHHLDIHSWERIETKRWFPSEVSFPRVLVTAGASCPDSLVEGVIIRLLELAEISHELDSVIERKLGELSSQQESETRALRVLS